MLTTNSRLRVAALGIFLASWFVSPVRCQTTSHQSVAALAAPASTNPERDRCVSDFLQIRPFAAHSDYLETSVFPGSPDADDYGSGRMNPYCTAPRSTTATLSNMAAKSACTNASGWFADGRSCLPGDEATALSLDILGKSGVEIRRARQEVLAILSSQNACREWFATKDAAPEVTFQSLGFLIDREGAEDVLASVAADSRTIIRQPYVARATQDGGSNTDITINARGAFFRSQAKLERSNVEGGPIQFAGEHWLNVGSYSGNSLQAQTLTLLHELGHVIDLLPEDSDDLDGKSARNTGEVLRHCRPEIDSRAKQAREMSRK